MSIPLTETVKRTTRLIQDMMEFWKQAEGWAPTQAAELLNKSMLEWQGSLADQLSVWCGTLSDGQLILAWANLGALVEGQMKLYISVYYQTYLTDADAIKKKGRTLDPDGVSLEPLILFFKRRVWAPEEEWETWVRMVQQRRNAIHAFKAKTIGTTDELHAALSKFLEFVKFINGRLPYPDGHYFPRQY